MTSFAERLAVAKAMPNPTRDVTVTLDPDELVTLRFTRLPGDAWADITARCPVRLDSPIDLNYGYDMQKASALSARYVDAAAKPYGVLVDGEEEVSPALAEWDDLFSTISGHEFSLIISAIYELNEYDPAQRVVKLKAAAS